MHTIELADIRIRAALPLHPYLSKHPHLFLRLVADGSVCGDTAGVDGDVASGVWEFNERLYAPRVKQSLNVAVLTGVKTPWIQLVSVTLKVAELLAREKACPNGHQYIVIFDSREAIELKFVVTCSIKLSSILGRVLQAVGANDHTINRRSRNNESDYDPERIHLMSREDLESLYLKTSYMPDQDDSKALQLSRLGHGFYALYRKEQGKADLEKAISIHEESMQFIGPSHPRLATHTHYFAVALLERFQQSGDEIDIERAISYFLTARRWTGELDASKPFQLSQLGHALQLRFQRFGGLADLKNSILCQRETIKLMPDDHPDMPGLFNNLGCALRYRFERLGEIADLEDSISNLRQAFQLTPNGHPGSPMWLNNLGLALLSRFLRLGGLADLEDAISNLGKAVPLVPDGHSDKPMLFNSLGVALRSRFERLGDLTDLEDAISTLRQAVPLTSDSHSVKLTLSTSLGLALQSRFERLGVLADLEESISNIRHAVHLMPDGHPDKPGQISNLGLALKFRFQRLGSLADLEDAIPNLWQAVQLAPNGHPSRPMWFNNLGMALKSRFFRLGGLADLEDAISNLRKAVPLVPDGHPEKPVLFNNLGIALRARFERLGHLADIDEAISNQRQAVQLMPDGYLDKPVRLYNLAIALESRFKRLGNLSDLETALSAFSTAANSILGSAMVPFKAARTWARVAEEHSRSPLDACQCAINLLPRIAWLGLALTDQHALLADVGRVVPDAVAAAIRYGKYETAVIWAEQGRSIAWQNLLGLRSPIDDLHETHPELAGRLRGIAKQLEGSGSHFEAPKASPGDFSVNYSKLAVEWDNIVEEVRRIPRFEGFLKAKSFRQLAPAAHEGPVVILNINGAQCDALVLISDDSVERKVSALHIPLERFSHEKSQKMFQTLTDLLSSAGVRERSDRKTGRVQSQADGEAKFKVILGILWKDAVKPVIEALAFQVKPQRPPRIWWCATGLLAFLPIHAAGLYDTQEVGEKVSDYVISSYTPTLSAILELSDPVVREDFQVLTVAQASAHGAPPIPKTEDEVRIIQGLATSVRVLNLTGKNATVERVQEGMMESNWIHLACHGQQNPHDPMESGFLLHDKVLKLSEIVKMSLPKADFAFLSACKTAMGDEKVAEESVHLAAGMLLSGCRGVIATTWSIRDEDGPRITEDVYSRIFKDGKPDRKEAAYALHEAVGRLRESGAQCTSWVPFIHIGR